MKKMILVASSDDGLLNSLKDTLKHFGYEVRGATRLAHVDGFIMGNRGDIAAVIMDSATLPATPEIIESLHGEAPVISLIGVPLPEWKHPVRVESMSVPKSAETAEVAVHIEDWHASLAPEQQALAA